MNSTNHTPTPTEKTPAEQLADNLRGHIGTANYYYLPHWGAHSLRYTDGIRDLCTQAECYWLLDELNVALHDHNEFAGGMWVVKITSHDYKGKLEIAFDFNTAGTPINSDGVRNVADYTKELPFTDFPEGEFQFYIENKIALLKSEY